MAYKKIVVTGGPCGGKSSALSEMAAWGRLHGYSVFILKECATDLMECGITPISCGKKLDCQLARIHLQVEKERLYEKAAATAKKDVLILCDRGVHDGKAYMSNRAFRQCLKSLSLSEKEVLDSYDAVFYLASAAVGVVTAYTCANNAMRTETPEKAAELDALTLKAWEGHKRLYKIGCYPGFAEKKQKSGTELACARSFPD